MFYLNISFCGTLSFSESSHGNSSSPKPHSSKTYFLFPWKWTSCLDHYNVVEMTPITEGRSEKMGWLPHDIHCISRMLLLKPNHHTVRKSHLDHTESHSLKLRRPVTTKIYYDYEWTKLQLNLAPGFQFFFIRPIYYEPKSHSYCSLS